MKNEPQAFEIAASRTLKEVVDTFSARGEEYEDSWKLENLVTTFLDSTLRRFGLVLSKEQKRLLMAAVLVDVKDSRMIGPYKRDTVVDGLAYRAAFAQWADDYEQQQAGHSNIRSLDAVRPEATYSPSETRAV